MASIARILHSAERHVRDARLFGPRFLLRHRRVGTSSVRVASTRLGRLHYRPGQSDLASFRQVFEAREYDVSRFPQWGLIQERHDELVGRGGRAVILDAGGNVGAAAVWFSRLFPNATVICVEPDHENASIARLNTEAIEQVRVVEAALGATAGHVAVRQHSSGDAWAINTVRAETGVPVVTVQDCVEMVEHGALLIAKIDIEGFESDVFSDNTAWIDDAAAIFVEIHDWMRSHRGASHAVQKAMFSRGRDMLICGENLLFV